MQADGEAADKWIAVKANRQAMETFADSLDSHINNALRTLGAATAEASKNPAVTRALTERELVADPFVVSEKLYERAKRFLRSVLVGTDRYLMMENARAVTRNMLWLTTVTRLGVEIMLLFERSRAYPQDRNYAVAIVEAVIAVHNDRMGMSYSDVLYPLHVRVLFKHKNDIGPFEVDKNDLLYQPMKDTVVSTATALLTAADADYRTAQTASA